MSDTPGYDPSRHRLLFPTALAMLQAALRNYEDPFRDADVARLAFELIDQADADVATLTMLWVELIPALFGGIGSAAGLTQEQIQDALRELAVKMADPRPREE